MKALLIILLIFSIPVYADDFRYCGIENIQRDSNGNIKRSNKIYREFRSMYPCPSTGRHKGACPGWAVDHVIPLAVGGCDIIENLQWLAGVLKSGSQEDCAKDRWERLVYKPNWNGVIDWPGCYETDVFEKLFK